MTFETKIMTDGWTVCSPSSARICRRHPLWKSKTVWPTKTSKFIEIEKVRDLDGIPNECLRHLPRRSLVHLTHLLVFNRCLRLSHFPKSSKRTYPSLRSLACTYIGVMSKEIQIDARCLGRIIYIQNVQWGTGRNLVADLLGTDISPSIETLIFVWERKESVSLIIIIEHFNLDNLYSKSRCHAVPKAF
jgi:hypothetical protein